MHRKHGIDRGTEGSGAWGRYPGGVSGAPSGKITMYLQGSNTIVLPLIFGIWFDVFPFGTACRPIQP